jgi:uncharacterized Zn finger protein
VAKSESREVGSTKKGRAKDAGWTGLTWEDLERWAGSRSVSRGRTYQRGGRVTDLRITPEGELLATVQGGERYATTVAMSGTGKSASLESSCTCPVGFNCKHGVAVVADFLQAVADGREVPIAAEDDPRWDDLESGGAASDDDWDDNDDESWDVDEEEEIPVSKPRRTKQPARRGASAVNWDDKIEQHLRAKTQGELADLVWSLVRRFPEISQEFRERIALQEGDVDGLLSEARREIKKVTSEPAWQNHWNDEGHTPDYSRVQHRFERLLELGHADEVVSLGREFIEKGMQQIAESHDEGETATAFAETLKVVFQAVNRSSLSGPERLLFAIDVEMDDDSDVIGEAGEVIFDAPSTPEDWSTVADTLARRLKTADVGKDEDADSFSRNYGRDRLADWVATALEEAGRDAELQTLYETEARTTGSYERIVAFLMGKHRHDDAERWAREGIAATTVKYPGIASQLVATLCEVARKRKKWDVVAAHAAASFFDHPSMSTFDELAKAADKAGVGETVRAAALRFLETGAMPYQFIGTRPAVVTPPRAKGSAKKLSASTRTPLPAPEKATPQARTKIDPSWPLPMPDYLVPPADRPKWQVVEPHPHLHVLLDMAIAAKRPDEVLRWFDRMRAEDRRLDHYNGPLAYADRVADAVSATHPERVLEIYMAALNSHLPQAHPSSYESAAGYLKKLRPVYKALGRADDWTALVASIREKYRNRPKFMEILDRLDGRTILQSSGTKRK